MRRSYNDADIIVNEKGEVIGYSLGYDFCSEHEWGYKDLKSLLGIRDDFPTEDDIEFGFFTKEVKKVPVMGLERRMTTTASSKNVMYVQEAEFAAVIVDDPYSLGYVNRDLVASSTSADRRKVIESLIETNLEWERKYKYKQDHRLEETQKAPKKRGRRSKADIEELKRREAEVMKNTEPLVLTAWDSSSFAIVTDGEHAHQLREVYDALLRNDAALVVANFSRGNPFANSSLCVVIASRVDEESKKTLKSSDEESFRTLVESRRTGIVSRLRAAKKKWFALRPSLREEPLRDAEGKPMWETRYPVVYWLNGNPDKGQHQVHGWYTVEQLEAWVDNKGPIADMEAGRAKG